jgi:hypothetical protein
MSAPLVLQATPSDQETDVILGQGIVVVFDQAIDTSTLNESTFSLTYQAPAQILTSNRLIDGDASPSTVPVTGTWSFATDPAGHTVGTFTPTDHLQPNTLYTAMLLGTDASLSTQDVMNPGGEAMVSSYQWTFTTGVLNLLVPPPSSPLLTAPPAIQYDQIKIIPRGRHIGQDLTQEIDILFPEDIDPTSFDISDIYMSIEPLLGDPTTTVPPGLAYAAVVSGNKIKITVTGWPAS